MVMKITILHTKLQTDFLDFRTSCAGHSFRIGAATSAALAEVEDSIVQILGQWQSAAFLRYVRTQTGSNSDHTGQSWKHHPSPGI